MVTRNTEDVLRVQLAAYRKAEMGFHNSIGTCFTNPAGGVRVRGGCIYHLQNALRALDGEVRKWLRQAEEGSDA